MSPDAAIDGSVVAVDAGVDGGSNDPGFDIPSNEWIDGGQGDAWGCYGRDDQRFIVRFETRDSSDPWCASVLFKRQDGGFPPLFPDFDGPDGFQISDARWALTCGGLELPNGELNHQSSRPVHGFAGAIELTGYVQGRPQNYSIDASIRIAYRTYWLSPFASMSATCQGP